MVATTTVVLAGNFDEDLESLLVVLQRSLVLTLAVVNTTDAEVGFGHVRPDVAASFNNIGAVYEGKGDFENALVQFQKALEIQTRVFGSDHPDVAGSYSNIGVVYREKGDLENALVQHQKALEIQTRVFGSDHLDVAKTRENMAIIYDQQGHYDQALEIRNDVNTRKML
jgi:tetratricopeptide (TPR) repeat protein